MTISGDCVWECRATATAGNVNGGGFVTGASGIDYSLQDAAQYALTGVTTSGAGAVFLTASAASDMVGNIARVVSGTNFTAGWYEIISVSVGVSVTVDRNLSTGTGSNGVINIGGAISLGSTQDDEFFESPEPGNTVWIRGGTYSLGETVNIAKAGGAQNPIKIIGYASTRGDNPTGANRPLITNGTQTWTLGPNWNMSNIRVTGAGNPMVVAGTGDQIVNCYFYNNQTATGRNAITLGSESIAINCEAISLRGRGFQLGNDATMIGCFAHDSDIGVLNLATSATGAMINCILSSNVTSAFNAFGSWTANGLMYGCTLYGQNTIISSSAGILLAAGVTDFRFMNNTISKFDTGASHGSAQSIIYGDFNNYFANNSNVSNITMGANDITLNPSFVDVTEVSGTGATTSNTGNTLVDGSATFVTNGITAGRDFVYISSTSGTVGKYGISSVDSETQLTLDVAPGNSSSNVAYQITKIRDFNVGANLQGVGFPGSIAGLPNGYNDIGALQAQSGGGGGGLLTHPGMSGGMRG